MYLVSLALLLTPTIEQIIPAFLFALFNHLKSLKAKNISLVSFNNLGYSIEA
jgi:hypothetical protein